MHRTKTRCSRFVEQMSNAMNIRCFVSAGGVDLPLNLIDPLESTQNRMTFFRGHYDAEGRMLRCEKVVYGEVELTHRYSYCPNGTLQTAEITDADEEVRVLRFDSRGSRLA
jgi:hypothetical protein